MKNLLVHMKLIFVVIVWGIGWPAGRVIAQDIAPFAASWIRYVVAVALFVIYLKLSNQWMIPPVVNGRELLGLVFLQPVCIRLFSWSE